MDEVEIKNYGRGGVASEATLQLLLDATKAQNLNQTQAARTQQRIQENYNKSQKDGTGIFKKTAEAAKGLGKEFLTGGDRVSDFSKHILGASSKFQSLIEYADDTVDQFRALSQVGAGFNNSIFDMMKTAGTAGMRLDEFYRVVGDNSEILRQLGGTVTAGAREFANLSRDLRSGDLGRRLFDLGFTVSDINDGMIAYMNTQVLQGRLQSLSQRELIAGSQEYLHEIDLLAKATGLSREALINQSQDLNENAQFQALMARAGAEGASDLDRNLSAVAGLMPGFTGDLLEMASGFRGTDLGIALNSVAGDAGQRFADLMANASNMGQEDFLRELSVLGPQIADVVQAMDPAQIGRLRSQGSPIAALFDAMGSFQRMGNIDPEAATRAQEQQDRITSILGGFSDSLARIKSEVLDAFLESAFMASLSNLGTSMSTFVTNLFGDGGENSGSANQISTGFQSVFDSLFGQEGYFTRVVNWSTELLNDMNESDDPYQVFKDRIGDLGRDIRSWFMDTFFGEVTGNTRADGTGNDIRSGGVIQSIKDGFNSMFEEGGFATTISNKFIEMLDTAKTALLNYAGIQTGEGAESLYVQLQRRIGIHETQVEGDNLMTRIMNKLFPAQEGDDRSLGERLGQSIIDGIASFFEGPTGQQLTSTIGYYFEGLMLSLQEAIDEKLGILSNRRLREEREAYEMRGLREGRLSPEEAAPLVARLQEQLQTNFSSMQSQLDYGIMPVGEQVSNTQNIIDTLRSAGIEVTVPENLPVRRVGTLQATGRLTEPADTVAKIHQGERVLNPSEAGAVNDLPGAINQLNTLTAQIRDLMAQSVQHQEKTARGIRKLGSDMMA